MESNQLQNNFKDFFQEKNLIFDLNCKTKKEAIKELVELLNKNYDLPASTEDMVGDFMEREMKGSTGMQNGIAIPHIKGEQFEQFYLAIGIHRQGFDYPSLDGKPTHVIFLLIAPLSGSTIHLKFLSTMSRLFLNKNFKDEIFKIENKKKLCEFFNGYFL